MKHITDPFPQTRGSILTSSDHQLSSITTIQNFHTPQAKIAEFPDSDSCGRPSPPKPLIHPGTPISLHLCPLLITIPQFPLFSIVSAQLISSVHFLRHWMSARRIRSCEEIRRSIDVSAGIFNQPAGTERVEEFLERGRHCSFVSFVIIYRIGRGLNY
jgi:hypothetical protein